MLAVSLWLATGQRWVGVSMAPETASDRWRVINIDPASELAPEWRGKSVTGLSGQPAGPGIALQAQDLLRQPDTLPAFHQFNQFLDRQNVIAELKQEDELYLVSGEHTSGAVSVFSARPVSSLPVDYWLLSIAGFTAWMFTASVWVFRSNFAIGGWLLAGAGFGYLLLSCSHSLYSNREFGMSGDLIGSLNQFTYFGVLCYSLCIMASVFLVPRQIIPNRAFAVFPALVFLLWLNNYRQWLEWPIHAHLFPFFCIMLIGLPLVIYQFIMSAKWKSSRGFRYILVVTVFCLLLANALYFLPVLAGSVQVMGDTVFILSLSLTFVILAAVIFRYSMFNARRWYRHFFRSWLLGLAGYLLLIALFIVVRYSIPLAFLAIAAVVLAAIMLGNRNQESESCHSTDNSVLAFISQQIQQPDRDFDEIWLEAIARWFSPLKSERQRLLQAAEVDRWGLSMTLPTACDEYCLVLEGKAQGSQLFSQQDLDTALMLFTVLENMTQSWRVKEEELALERGRIMQNLHDDVTPYLLNITHQSKDPGVRDIAKNAIDSLRETIYSLDDRNSFTIDDLLLRLESELRQRMGQAAIDFSWSQEIPDIELVLGPLKCHNIKRVVSEIASNILKHSNANHVQARAMVKHDQLSLLIADDGAAGPVGQWASGIGMKTSIRRMEEVGGDIIWQNNPCEDIVFPCGVTVIVYLRIA